jgi:hypothetical protein
MKAFLKVLTQDLLKFLKGRNTQRTRTVTEPPCRVSRQPEVGGSG